MSVTNVLNPVNACCANLLSVGASTSAVLSATAGGGAKGDWLSHITIVPGTVSAGGVSFVDGTGTANVVFNGGNASLSTLVPFSVPVGALSQSGSWRISTGANVGAIGYGNFT